MSVPQLTIEHYNRDFAARHLLHGVVDYWAEKKPDALAVIQHEPRRLLTWAEFRAATRHLAGLLAGLGLRKGDFLATSLPFIVDHILLEYACFRLGVVFVPLDLRLRPNEIAWCLKKIEAKAYCGLPDLCAMVRTECPFVPHVFSAAPQVTPAPYEENAIQPGDGAFAIFTTGSTGSPKPALLSHRNVTVQNMCIGAAFDFRENTRVLLNLPPSHIGGQGEAMMTAFFYGGTAVTLAVFDPGKSIAAIAEHRVSLIGQIPAMFQYEWRNPEFAKADLSSLETAIFGGQQVTAPFIERVKTMAPRVATGLGLTECGGFCTYTSDEDSVEKLTTGLGVDMPIYPMSVREAMREDGTAGEALADGEIGHICFRGPQTFLGYVNDAGATARTISSDGFLYTGDLGYKRDGELHLAGRAKWIIKPAGYQVFPGDVENHIAKLPQVVSCGVVGAAHRTLSEAVVAFVEVAPGATLTVSELRQHARGIASYMRPLHYVLMEAGRIPLGRSTKTDYIRLSQMAHEEVERLRDAGRWDR